MIDFKNYKGALPSPEDKRDYTIADCMDVTKGTFDDLPYVYKDMWMPEVRDQGDVGSCTAFALTTILKCIHHKIYSYDEDYSVGGLYGNRFEGGSQRPGREMRSAVDTVLNYGDFLASDFECLEEVPEVIQEFMKAYEEQGHKMKKLVKSYIRIKNEDQLRSFLWKYKIPVFVNVNISSFMLGSGLHALACYGYDLGDLDGRNYYCQNSWGDKKPILELKFRHFKEVWGLVPMEDIKFTDIQEDRWSATAINEAAKDGIVEGFPDGEFKPEEPLTREQIAVIWHRMKKYIDKGEK
jgi:hypothetical protein